MNDEIVENFLTQRFTSGSAIFKVLYYNPLELIIQHIPVGEKIKKTEINRMRNEFIIDTLTVVDIQEVVKFGGKVIRNFEGVIHKESFKTSKLRKVFEKLFIVRQKNKNEVNDIMLKLVKVLLNSLYVEDIRKDITKESKCKSEYWISTEYDERIFHY